MLDGRTDFFNHFLFWIYIQSLYYETGQTVLFWDILWHKNFVCMNCETYLALEYAHKPAWPTGFEKSEIHQPYLEKLQFSGSKIEAFLGNFSHFPSKSSKNASILLPLNYNFSRLGWCISDFSKPVGQAGLLAYPKVK